MGWAANYIKILQEGRSVTFRPRGHSMSGKIENGQEVTVSPSIDNLRVGDVVLCKVGGREYLHLIKAIKGDRYQIGNNKGGINGWIGKNSIFGKYNGTNSN